MDLERFDQLINHIHDRRRLSPADKDFIRHELPLLMGGLPQIDRIREYDHPAGVHIKGAPVRSLPGSLCTHAGQKSLWDPEVHRSAISSMILRTA